jgi:hypothetical protein
MKEFMKDITSWSFESSKSWKGFNDSAIERFKKGRYLSLAREVIQNSNDAILHLGKPVRIEFELLRVGTETIPDVEGLRKKIASCLPHAKEDNNPEAAKWFNEAQKILQDSKIGVLKMADFNTTGISGPCELGTPFFAYMRAMGTSVKPSENSGGSHGIGKRAPLACSNLRTLFVVTKYKGVDDTTETLAQGLTIMMSHSKDRALKTGPFVDAEGYWGVGDDAYPVEDLAGLPDWMSRGEIGTSIYLIAFEETSKWQERLIAITLSNYFAAIYRGNLEVKIGDTEITKDTISSLFELFPKLLASLEDEEEIIKFINSKYFFEALRPIEVNPDLHIEEGILPILGKTSVRIIVRDGMPNEYAIIRGGMLITTALPQLKHFPNYRDFVAVVECLNPDGEKLLRRMEPSRHDDFEPDQFESEEDQKNARTALKQLQTFIRSAIKKYARESTGEAGAIDFLSSFLSDDSEKGVDAGECDLNPLGKVIISPKPIKTVRHKAPEASEPSGDDGGSGEGPGEGGGGGGGGPGEGGGKGGKGKKVSTYSKIRDVRVFKANDVFKISLTPEESKTVKILVYAVGQDFEEKIPVVKCAEGQLQEGGIVISLTNGKRIQIEANLQRDSLGSYRVYAEDFS